MREGRITTSLSDRAGGSILGGAIGDAMGGPFEGQPGPIQFRDHTKWSISDDTQLTLATCESIIQTGEVSPEHIAGRFLHWYRARRITGMGSSTLKALRDLDAGLHWALAGARGEMAAGNGAAMRIAPLAFHLDPGLAQDRQIIRDVCRITHHNEEAYVGALALVIAIRSLAFRDSSPEQLFESVLRYLPDSGLRDRVLELSALPDQLNVADVASQFGSSGYVVESVPLALYAARSIVRSPFDAVLRSVIEAGGDTDTVASMTGQIAGAWIGGSEISRDLIQLLPNASDIKQIANDFAGNIATENLFSYGTLQTEDVQLSIFGRRLKGRPDALVGYSLTTVEVKDQAFVAHSGAVQRNLRYTGVASDTSEGALLTVTRQELERADAYEPAEYTRKLVQLKSGVSAWIYLTDSE